jgi:hypothetical protein
MHTSAAITDTMACLIGIPCLDPGRSKQRILYASLPAGPSIPIADRHICVSGVPPIDAHTQVGMSACRVRLSLQVYIKASVALWNMSTQSTSAP